MPDFKKSDAKLEARLRETARSFRYPPTPDIATTERLRLERLHRRARWQVSRKLKLSLSYTLALVILLGSLFLVTPVRAQLVDWLRVGAVNILFGQSPAPLGTSQPDALIGLAGETTLARAAQEAPFPVRLPEFPPDLNAPERVYLQKINETTVVILVWLHPDKPDAVRLALYQIGVGNIFEKQWMQNVQETTVNGQWAVWMEGPYVLKTLDGQMEARRVVQGHTLLWIEEGVTYRLESDLPLDEARKIAESLQAWKGP